MTQIRLKDIKKADAFDITTAPGCAVDQLRPQIFPVAYSRGIYGVNGLLLASKRTYNGKTAYYKITARSTNLFALL